MYGRPFGGTVALYKSNLACNVSLMKSDNARCTAVKFLSRNSCDLIVVSVYMPFRNGSIYNNIEYEHTVGYLQGLIDSNLGCDFIFGGDFNVSSLQHTVASRSLLNFCSKNNIAWLKVDDSNAVNYSYHSDKNGHFSLIDHMLVSQSILHKQTMVDILVDDYNSSDHYAI